MMFLSTLGVGLALADDGTLWMSWERDLGRVQLEAPAGEHLAPGAPASLVVQTTAGHYTLEQPDLEAGARVPLAGPGAVSGVANYSLCEDGGTACRIVERSFFGLTLDSRKGRVPMVEDRFVALLLAPVADPAAEIQAAFDQAAQDQRPLLLDFSAEWCPPCQVLAAEVLHDPDNAADLAGFVVLEVDADDPVSWPLKDRYQVGGYPTVIAAGPDGTELGRHVGYDTEAEFRAWLANLPTASLDERVAGAGALADFERVALAQDLLDAGREDGVEDLVAGLDSPGALVVRFQLAPTADAVPALIDQAPWLWDDWIWGARRLDLSEPTRAALFDQVVDRLTRAETDDGPALAFLAGDLAASPGDAQGFHALGAHLTLQKLTGDPQLDRGYWLDLASFLEDAGQIDRAVEVLENGGSFFPTEFTWAYNQAGILQRAGRAQEALPLAQTGLERAHGDQRLRAARRAAELLAQLGDTPAAVALLEETLASAERPDATVQVRTHRYLAALETLLAGLSAP